MGHGTHHNPCYPPDLLMFTRERTPSDNGVRGTADRTAFLVPPQSKVTFTVPDSQSKVRLCSLSTSLCPRQPLKLVGEDKKLFLYKDYFLKMC